jgi:hypothetical protein
MYQTSDFVGTAGGLAQLARSTAVTATNSGGEDYFFRNIENGIGTPDDLAIWGRLNEKNADFPGQ